jgi:hypothetical protein
MAGMALNLVPALRKRHIEDHSPACGLGMTANEGIGHHPSDVVTDDIGALQFERRRELMDVL